MSEGNVYEELLNSGPFAIIELFELKTFETMHGSDETYYFHAGRNRKTTEPSVSDDIVSAYSIYWNGNYYLPLPCLLYTSPSPRDAHESRMPSSA